VSPTRDVLHTLARLRVGHARPILLVALVTLGVIVGPSIASAAQLTLSWVDNSGGQASFIIQRATGTSGTSTQIAQTALGAASYSDATVSLGTTYCYQVAAVNSAGTSSFSNLACGSPSGGFTITAAKAGTAVGTVGSSPAGINCGTACSYTYPAGTAVTLSATAASGSIFSGWTGGGCSSTDPCTLAGNGSVTVTATFAAVPAYTLTVNKSGPGTVSSSPGGISCGSTCSASFASGSAVTLTAVPGRGARFNGWSGGGCSGTGTCTVTLNTALSVTANFSKGGKK
jgi:Divergent InlB B-repeat domain